MKNLKDIQSISTKNLTSSINTFKNLFNSPEKKRFFSNFISLSVLQGANYILPLITFPYLVRVLGVEKFGLLSFANAAIAYFNILTDYGFNLSATREISIHREDKEKVKEIFSSVMIIKLVLLTLSFVLLIILVFSFERLRKDYEIYFLSFGMVLGQVLFPVWFFLGMEKMKHITFLNILARGIFTVAIFIFVKAQTDYWKVPLINFLGFIIAGLISLWIIHKDFEVRFKWVGIRSLVNQLKEGWYIFISTIAISLYTVSTTFILGIFTNNTIVGYYAAADKIIQAVKGLMSPIFQSLYPFINKKVSESEILGLNLIRKITKFVAIITFTTSLLVLIFSDKIVTVVLGNGYQESIIILMILSFHPFLIGLSNIFGVQTMLSFNRKKIFQNILVTASILNIMLSLILVPHFKYIGSAISVTMVEIFVTLAMFIYLQKSGIKILELKNV